MPTVPKSDLFDNNTLNNVRGSISIDVDPTKPPARKSVHLEFRNITYVIKQGKKERTILNNVSGFVQPGEMLAILGPSGTLLVASPVI